MALLLPELRYRRLWFALGMVMVIAFAVACLLPGRLIPKPIWVWSDKVKHFAAFAVLAFWFGSIVTRRWLWWSGLALMLYGAAIEWAQYAMALGRSAEFYDVLANGVGIVLGLLLALTILGRWPLLIEVVGGGMRR